MSTYEDRKKDGKKCLTTWLTPDAVKNLDYIAKKLRTTRTGVLERLLTREAKMLQLLDGAKPAAPQPRVMQRPPEPRMPEARALVDEGTPADLARRVLDRGRREATIVSSGKRVRDGREVRR